MSELPLNSTRRRRTNSAQDVSASGQGAASILRASLLVIVLIVAAVCIVAPNQVDRMLGRTAAGASSSNEVGRLWRSALSALGDSRPDQHAGPGTAGTPLQQNQTITTDSTGQTILTRGRDIVDMAPKTTVAISDGGAEGSTTVVRLFDGTIHVEAAKRISGETFAVETVYMVATVKGTVFDVTTLDGLGTAVTVTEGVVSVRATASGDLIDVTPGNTAAVSAAAAATPILGPTPPGGAAAAIKAAGFQPSSGN